VPRVKNKTKASVPEVPSDKGAILTSIHAYFYEMDAFNKTYSSDLQRCSEALRIEPGSQFWRRTAVRTSFAFYEGSIWQLKQIALTVCLITKIKLSEHEICLIKEVGTDREGKEKKLKISLKDNLKFACEIALKTHRASFPLSWPSSDLGYDAFLKSIEIRDRLMHPKSKEGLEINDDEYALLLAGWNWHQALFLKLLGACHKAIAEDSLMENRV
jgi:hypothetical protein